MDQVAGREEGGKEGRRRESGLTGSTDEDGRGEVDKGKVLEEEKIEDMAANGEHDAEEGEAICQP